MDDIRTLDDPAVAQIRALLTASSRALRNQVLLENEENVASALKAGVTVEQIFVAEGVPPFRAVDIPTRVVARPVLASVFEATRAPSVFAIARIPQRPTLATLGGRSGDVVVLDGVDGPGNIGSIIRIAAAFEAAGIVFLDRHRPEIFRRGIVRASMGTMFHLPLVTATVAQLLGFCKHTNMPLVVTAPRGRDDLADVVARPERMAFVLGSETRGCRPELVEKAGVACRIPLSDDVESLNVSAAASILLFLRSPGWAGRRADS